MQTHDIAHTGGVDSLWQRLSVDIVIVDCAMLDFYLVETENVNGTGQRQMNATWGTKLLAARLTNLRVEIRH